MKTFNFIQFIFIAVSLTLHGQESTSFKPFGQHSDLLAKGDMMYSLFTKGEYGILDKLTIRLHPLWIFMAPSIDARWQWKKSEKRSVSFVTRNIIPYSWDESVCYGRHRWIDLTGI